MSAYAFAIRALMSDVAEIMVAAESAIGMSVEHALGIRHRVTNSPPPKYIWVPTRSRQIGPPATSDVDQVRSLCTPRLAFFVDCWGSSFDVADAMATNLLRALNLSAFADVAPESEEWLDPSKSWNQKGEVLRVEYSLEIPRVDGWVHLIDLLDPEPAIAEIEEVENNIEMTSDVEDAGELAVTFTVGSED